jgi:TIR domain
MMERVKVFISYSHKDEIWKDRLLTHLSVLDYEGLLHVWTDRRIEVGTAWQAMINDAMSDSRVAVLLVTANFLTSEFILNQEVPSLLELHAQRGMLVLPLLARPCPWKLVSWLAPRQVGPKDGHPLSAGNEVDVDADLTALTYAIASLINRIDSRTAAEQLMVSDRILERQSRLPIASSSGSQLGSLEPKSAIASIDLAYRALEKAFQIVQASGTGATPSAIVALIELAIAHGAPIYNDQSHLGCALIYSHAARLLLELLRQSPSLSNIYQLLKAASPIDLLTSENADKVAWSLRHAFDTILAFDFG